MPVSTITKLPFLDPSIAFYIHQVVSVTFSFSFCNNQSFYSKTKVLSLFSFNKAHPETVVPRNFPFVSLMAPHLGLLFFSFLTIPIKEEPLFLLLDSCGVSSFLGDLWAFVIPPLHCIFNLFHCSFPSAFKQAQISAIRGCRGQTSLSSMLPHFSVGKVLPSLIISISTGPIHTELNCHTAVSSLITLG